jgi:hypothetical protein
MEDKKIVVIFSGGNYSVECPLLYYAGTAINTNLKAG